MSKVSRVVKNTFINFSGAIASSVFMLVFNILMARYLGSGNYGFLSFAVSYIAMFSIINDFGVPTIAVREVARDNKHIKKYFGNVFAFKLIAAFIVFAIAVMLIPFFKMDRAQSQALLLFTIASLIYMAHSGYRWVFQAYQMLEYDAALNVLQGAITLAGGLAVIYFSKGVLALSFVWLAFNSVVFLTGLFFAYRVIGFIRLELDFDFLKGLFVSALPIGLTFIFSAIYLNLDKILLFKLVNSYEVAWYSTANKLMLFLKSIMALYIPAIFPALSHFSAHNESGFFDKLLRRSMDYFLMLTLAVALGTTLLSGQIIGLIFGEMYFKSAVALQIMIWGIPLSALNLVLSYAFVSKGDQMRSLVVIISGFLLNVVCNLLLIPSYGYIASSISLVAAELLMFALLYHASITKLHVSLSLKKIVPILVSLAVMGAFTHYLSSYNLFVNVILSAAVYAAALIVTRAVNEEDWNLMKKVYLKQI